MDKFCHDDKRLCFAFQAITVTNGTTELLHTEHIWYPRIREVTHTSIVPLVPSLQTPPEVWLPPSGENACPIFFPLHVAFSAPSLHAAVYFSGMFICACKASLSPTPSIAQRCRWENSVGILHLATCVIDAGPVVGKQLISCSYLTHSLPRNAVNCFARRIIRPLSSCESGRPFVSLAASLLLPLVHT